MSKRLQEYVKYTTKELDSYTQTEGSCVRKVNTNLHFALGPYCLEDFKEAFLAYIIRKKVGFYDKALNGIVLDIKHVKVLGTVGAIRADDCLIHVNVNADCYIFQPEPGAVLSGIVKHIGNRNIGVIIYRVFNVSIRTIERLSEDIQMDQEVKFYIKKFNLQSIFPYIEGELLSQNSSVNQWKKNKEIKLETHCKDSAIDSGFDEKEVNKELDELIKLIKKESVSDSGSVSGDESHSSKSSKRKQKSNAPVTATVTKVKSESKKELSKKKRKSVDPSA